MNKDLNSRELVIKTFSPQQIEPCAKLYVEIFGKPPWNEHWSLNAVLGLINKIINKENFIGFFAEYGGEARGYILGYLLKSYFPFNKIYYINELFIDLKYQNLKIGKGLVNTLIDDLREKQVPWVVLLTKKDTIAEKFYKGMGFRRIIPGFSLNNRIIMYYRPLRNGLEN